MQLASGGLSALSGDLIEELLGLVPAAMRCSYETAPVVRLYTLEVLTYAHVCSRMLTCTRRRLFWRSILIYLYANILVY